MRIISNIKKWFLILLSMLIIFSCGIILIFLFHPQYFIDDLESLIEGQISSNTDGKLDIGNFGGNFIQGFNMYNIQYKENGKIIYSASKMYIDPDLSRIFLGNAVVSEMIIWNSYYQHRKLSNYDEDMFSGNYNILGYNFEIRSILIDKQLLIYEEELFKLNGRLTLDCGDEIIIAFNNLKIDSPSFSDSVTITSGSLALNDEQLTFEDIKLISNWIVGQLDGGINYKDYSKSHGSMIFDTLSISLNDSAKINLENIKLTLANNNNIPELTMSGDIMYKDFQLDNIFIKGVLHEKDVLINSAKFKLLNNNIKAQGLFNLEKFNWNTSITLDAFKYGERAVVNGTADITSSFFFENIQGHLDLTNIQIDSVFIHSANGEFRYDKEELFSAEINIISNGYNGLVNIQSFIDDDNYNISGNINFDEFDIPQYISLAGRNQITGNMDFSFHVNDGISKLNLKFTDGKGYWLNSAFNNFIGKANIIVNDELVTGQSQGSFNNWIFGAYDWENIDYKVEYSDIATSTYSLSAFGCMGDSLEIIAEKLSNDKIYISKFEGALKQSKIYTAPFYIVIADNSLHFPEINLKIGYGNILLRGIFNDYDRYDFDAEISDVNLDHLYSISGNNYPLKGNIRKGLVSIKKMKSSNLQSPRINLNVEINNGLWDDVSFDKLSLSTKYNNRRLEPFKLDVDTPLGFMRSKGWCNIGLPSDSVLFIPEDSLNFSIAFDKFDLLKVNKYFPWGFETRGVVNGTAKINGTAENIQIIGNIDINNPGFDKIDGKSISSEFTYRNHQLDFSKIHLATAGGRYSGFGDIPIKLDLLSLDELLINQIPIDFVFTGLTNNIEILPYYFLLIDSMKGMPSEGIANSFNIILEITGNLNNPIRNGELIINNGLLYLNPIDEVIDNISGNIKIKNNILIIDNFNGRLIKTESDQISIPFIEAFKRLFSDGKDKVGNNFQITGTIDLTKIINPDYSIHMMGNDIHLTSSYNLFQGSGQADVYVSGQDTVLITGKFQPNPNEFTITSLGNETLYDIELRHNKKLYIYDIHVPFEDGIQVQTENLNALLDGDVTISKTGNDKFGFSGKVNIIDGRFYDKQGNMYENMSGSIFLAPDENSSHLDIHSNTSINTSIIDVTILGNPNHPVTYFTDNEGRFTQTELLSMLAFGNTVITNNSNQIQDIFTNYFENEVERNISQNTPLDEFQFTTSGSLLETIEGTDDIDIKLILGKRLSNRIYLNTQIDIKDFNENQYEAVYQLSRNSSIVGGLNTTEENNSLHLKYRLKYYY